MDVDQLPAGTAGLAPLAGRSWRALGRHLSSAAFLRMAIVVIVAVPVLAPLLDLAISSFSDSAPGQALAWSFAPWERALTNTATLKAMLTSLLLTVRVPISVAISLAISWFLIRVDVPGRRFITYALWFACFLPVVPVAFGWMLLLEKSYGLVNKLIEMLPFVTGPIFNINTVWGILWFHITLTTVPITTMLLMPAVRVIDASYEEGSEIAGASLWTTLRRIVLPLLAPAVLVTLLAGFIKSLESFEAEQILGVPANISVYTTRVYALLENPPTDFPQAAALSTLLLVVLFAVAVAYQLAQNRYAENRTLGGKGVRVRERPRGVLAWSVASVLYAGVFVCIVAPFGMLVAGSFTKLFGFFAIDHPWTLGHWQTVLTDAAFRSALGNSLLVSFAVAVLGTAMACVLGVLIARSNDRVATVIALAAWLPWAIPGLLLGMAYLTLFLEIPGLSGLLSTPVPLILVLTVQALPLGTMMIRSVVNQLSTELEEASQSCGAGPINTYLRIVIPLLAPILTTVFVISFMGAIRDISSTVLLAVPGTQTLSLLMFQYATGEQQEAAATVGVIIALVSLAMTTVVLRIGESLSLE